MTTIINLTQSTEGIENKVKNWNELPEDVQATILNTNHVWVHRDSMQFYNERKTIIECNYDELDDEIYITSAYTKEGKVFESDYSFYDLD